MPTISLDSENMTKKDETDCIDQIVLSGHKQNTCCMYYCGGTGSNRHSRNEKDGADHPVLFWLLTIRNLMIVEFWSITYRTTNSLKKKC